MVLNVYSGPRRQAAHSQLVELFFNHGIKAQIFPCASGAAVRVQAETAVRQGYPLIVAAGGDGTVSTVAGAILGSESVMGVLPTGTFNHFARDAGIPTNLAEAVHTLNSSNVRVVDTAALNGRTFVNTSSIGLYPRLVLERERSRRTGRGRIEALITAGFSTLRKFDRLYARINAGEKVWEGFTPFIFVGNNSYAIEGSHLAERPSLDGGHLFVCVAASSTRFRFLRLGMEAWLGGLQSNSDFHSLTSRQLSVDSNRRRLPVSLDGEVEYMPAPLRYTAQPRSLRIRVP